MLSFCSTTTDARSELMALLFTQADRLLELGFQEEVTELLQACPVGRQTLLFSATMNTKVDDLAKLALHKVGVTDSSG